MADILEEIVAHKRIEMEQRKRFISPRQMVTLTDRKIKADEGLTPGGSMRDALMSSSTGIIAEFKRKSPSKGWIKKEGKARRYSFGLSAEWSFGIEYSYRYRLFRRLRRIYTGGPPCGCYLTYII